MASVTYEESASTAPDFSDRIIDTFISFLKAVFTNIDEFRFDENDSVTQIMVYDKFARNLDAVGKKPALVTDLKPITKGNVSMLDRHGIDAGYFTTGAEYKTDLFRTVLIIHSMSSVQAESRRLAYLVGFSIFAFREEFYDKGIFDVFVPTVVGEPRKLITSSQGELWSTPTTVQIEFQDIWVKKIINSDILQKFAITVNATGVRNPGC